MILPPSSGFPTSKNGTQGEESFTAVNKFIRWTFIITKMCKRVMYEEFKSVPCLTYSYSQSLREKCSAPILKHVNSDVTRYCYGDEQHLDEALKWIFQYGQEGGIPRRSALVLQLIREEVTQDDKYCLVLVFEAKALQLSDFRQHQNLNEVVATGKKPKRLKNSCSVQKVRSRVYNPAIPKTCHQCRQKTRGYSALCKNEKKGKLCPLKFCRNCLNTRYGEESTVVALLDKWKCPKCRGICNCSYCMKKRGKVPTGPLFHQAKAAGFKCVLDMLAAKDARNSGGLESNNINDVAVLASQEATVEEELGELEKGNSSDVNSGLKLDPVNVQEESSQRISKKTKCKESKEISMGSNADGAGKRKSRKRTKICKEVSSEEAKGKAKYDTEVCNKVSEKETKVDTNYDAAHVPMDGAEAWTANDFCLGINNVLEKVSKGMAKLPNVGMNSEIEKIEEEIPLPLGTELTEILDIDFPPEDAGSALQLLEFCRVFGKVLDLKNGEAEAMLRELVCKRSFSSGQKTLVVQFQIRVLTLILTDSRNGSPSLTARNGNNSWLKPLEDLITESYLVRNDFPLGWLQEGIDGYYKLDLSKKLTLLNFLCDEALVTRKLRSYIEEQHSTHVKEVKETKSKVAAAKKKEKDLKQKLENEMAKAVTSNVAPLSKEEHKALLTKMKDEVAQAHTEMLELKGTTPKGKPSADAMRTNPEFLDSNGQAFWKLKSYNDEHVVLLQDIKIEDETATAAAPDEKWFLYGPEKKDEVDKYISSRAKRLKSIEASRREANM